MASAESFCSCHSRATSKDNPGIQRTTTVIFTPPEAGRLALVRHERIPANVPDKDESQVLLSFVVSRVRKEAACSHGSSSAFRQDGGDSDGSPLRRLSDELLQDQHIKLMPQQAIALLHQRLGLLLRQRSTTQRQPSLNDHPLQRLTASTSSRASNRPETPRSVERSNGAIVEQSIPSTLQMSSMLSMALRVSIRIVQTVSPPLAQVVQQLHAPASARRTAPSPAPWADSGQRDARGGGLRGGDQRNTMPSAPASSAVLTAASSQPGTRTHGEHGVPAVLATMACRLSARSGRAPGRSSPRRHPPPPAPGWRRARE